jgi:hypothetical protein
MFTRAFHESTDLTHEPKPKPNPNSQQYKSLAHNPSLQTYISQSKIPTDSLINRQLQAVPLGGTRKDTWLQALESQQSRQPSNLHTSKYGDFQHTATLGMEHTLNARNQALHSALEGSATRVQSATPTTKHIDYTKNRISYKKDLLENYDFCTELHDTTRPPYKIECLKKEFLREGGQSGAALFPSEDTLKFWNSHQSWLNVKGYIRTLSESTDSMNLQIQKKAILDFYGVIVEPTPQESPIQDEPGLEAFWFTHSIDLTAPTTFLGRRIRTTIPFMNKPLAEKDGSPTKKDMMSILYFTDLKVYEELPIFIRVTADDGFGTHFNGSMAGYTNNKRVNGPNELTSLTYMTPTTFTMKEEWLLKPNGPNFLTGYYHQGIGGLYYKLELWDGETWNQIPERMLRLTRDPFAPMMSFEIEKNPGKYGCNFPFCDQRFGGYKMMWKPQPGGGPNWSYSVVPNREYPFGNHMMLFSPGGGGIMSHFSMKLYSFMTFTLLVTIQEVPTRLTDIVTFHSLIGQISIRLSPISADTMGVSLATSKNGSTTDNPTVKVGIPYIYVVRMLRNEYDVNSLDSIQIAAIPLRAAQIKPDDMKESTPLLYKDPLQLENPNSKNAYTLYLGGNARMIVYWLRFFDYYIKAEGLKKESLNIWN